MKKDPVTARDIEVINSAKLFTTFRFAGRGNRDRREFPSLEKAREDAGTDTRALVYAVSTLGDRVLVPRHYSPKPSE